MRVLILDSEAVSALAEQRNGMAQRLAATQQADHRVLIPAVPASCGYGLNG